MGIVYFLSVIFLLVIFFFLWLQQRKLNRKLKKEIEENSGNARHWLTQQGLSELEERERKIEELKLKEQNYKNEIQSTQRKVEEFRQIRNSINEAVLRERALEEKKDFYRICLSQEDIDDISELKELIPRLRHREILPKLMWDTMVSRATKEMIKRITGGRTVGGIYKITYIPTGEAYIGKTTDFGTRWQSHVQTALGMEKVARSTLHVHMASHGIQNYIFEILEEVPREKQTEREKFYIELYGTQKQLNMRIG